MHTSTYKLGKLKRTIPMLSSIQRATAITPSFSVGVLHHGEIIFTHCEGIKDAASDTEFTVDLETAYLLGSLTKAFISTSCGILVDEEKLEWEKPISSERAKLLDALSHSTGFPQIDISWYGAQGGSIIPPEDRLHDADLGWGKFLRRRILGPLKMTRSCSNRESLVDSNFAEPHTALDNGEPGRLPVPDFSDKTITDASAAVWSTVPDMLKWSKVILDRVELEAGSRSESEDDRRSPLHTINENSYSLGWARHVIPLSHLGWLSTNGPQSKYILGRDSRPRLLFHHGGQITGYLNSIYLFPETQSAVIVLTNAQGAGDCLDWIAQAIIQKLFDLKPALDFQLNQYKKMKQSYEHNRHKGTPEPNILADDGNLLLQFNHQKSRHHKLRHYRHYVFGFLPESREEQQLRCLVDYVECQQFLVPFERGKGAACMDSISWRM
ncbi:beta-lactamase/transpeptidase-like protein [Xylaria telfairii]|nr:beta-lactamase/transpeptidase-like protein [Xylaria telfairii]